MDLLPHISSGHSLRSQDSVLDTPPHAYNLSVQTHSCQEHCRMVSEYYNSGAALVKFLLAHLFITTSQKIAGRALPEVEKCEELTVWVIYADLPTFLC